MRRVHAFLLAAILSLGSLGCDLFEDPAPEEARLLVEGTPGVEIRLVTSLRFFAESRAVFDSLGFQTGDTTLVSLLDADTVTVALPFEKTYDIRRTQRFFFRVVRLNPDQDELQVRTWVDDQLKFSDQPQPARDEVQFIYSFQNVNDRPRDDV